MTDAQVATGFVQVNVSIVGAGANGLADTLSVELFEFGGGTVGEDVAPAECESVDPGGSLPSIAGEVIVECVSVPTGDYVVGVDGVPDTARVDGFCVTDGNVGERLPGTNVEFTLASEDEVVCPVRIEIPTLLVDKVVLGADAAPVGDFQLEVYDEQGQQVATATDPSAATCDPQITDVCAAIALDEGTYQLGEVPVLGYLPTNVGCRYFVGRPTERFPGDVGAFDLVGGDLPPLVYCEITNEPFEGDVKVNKVLINDDGGTATEADFAAEVFTEPGGSLVTQGGCTDTGTCIDEAVPVGTFRVGESAPEGYATTVECEVTGDPEPPVIGTTPPSFPIDNEALPGDDAVFELGPAGEVRCTITNDDVPRPTTTTTTTTTTTSTTSPPPPAPAPTTTTGAGQVPPVPELPETGSDGANTELLATLAAGFVLLGGVLVAVRRRS